MMMSEQIPVQSHTVQNAIPTEEEWRKGFRELKELRKKILEKMYPENGPTNEKLYDWFQQKQKAFFEKLREGGFGDHPTEYAAYHVWVGGSSTGPDMSPYIDFPEPYSYKTHLENSLAELENVNAAA